MSTTVTDTRIGLCVKQGNSPKILMDYCDAYVAADGSILLALADGMGGYGGGEVASQEAVNAAIEIFRRDGFGNTKQSLAEAISVANQRVGELQRKDPKYAQMGTTMVLAAISQGSLVVAHVGDSRGVLFRGNMLMRLTTDHLVVVEREGAHDNGVKSNPNFKGRANVLSRYVGGPPPVPDFFEMRVESGDIVLLASDGITEYVLEDRMSHVVRSNTPDAAAALIVDEAIRNRSHDHCSVAIARV